MIIRPILGEQQTPEIEHATGRLRYVHLLEASVVLALCSYFYLKWRSRKQASHIRLWQPLPFPTNRLS
jgi:hypothetical protein